MVKIVELQVTLDGYTAEALFELVYGGNGEFLRHFHKTVNQDPNASVGDWEGNERTVDFTTPVEAPAFIKRVIGRDAMRVVETQRRERLADGSATLSSTPVPDMPGGAKFATQAVLTFRTAPGGGACQIDATVTCSAAGPYGLTAAIESFMADAGRKSLQEFLAAVQQYAQAAAPSAPAPVTPPPSQDTAAAAAAPPAEPPFTEQLQHVEPAEQFFDAEEPPLPAAGMRFEDSALLYLRYMCRSGDQTVGLLQALETELRRLQSDVAELRAAAEQQRRRRRWLPDLPDTVSTRQALLGAALLASSSAAAALLWSRRRYQTGA